MDSQLFVGAERMVLKVDRASRTRRSCDLYWVGLYRLDAARRWRLVCRVGGKSADPHFAIREAGGTVLSLDDITDGDLAWPSCLYGVPAAEDRSPGAVARGY